ncbi:MAG: Cof-type HAD-IIB family hydrolase [Bacillaceae bacterium]
MTYKMIVLDMDDTLLRDDHTISPRTKQALLDAQKAGVKVVLASGRPTYAMVDVAKELELDKYGSFILSFNGGRITDCRTNEDIFSKALSVETMHHMIDISKRENIYIHTYVGNDILTDKNNEYTTFEGKITNMEVIEVADLKAAVTEPVIKALMVYEPEHLAIVEKKLQAEFAGQLSIMRSKPFFLEITENGVDKGQSLHHLIQKLGITQEEVIAMGDSYNDVTMIKFAGLGVAMGNAPQDIKELADHVTETNMNDGVALVVEDFILNKLATV